MHFPFNIRPAAAMWNAVNRPTPQEFAPLTDEVTRGKYLVDVLDHCAECHSPRTSVTFAIDKGRYLEGSVIEGFYAPALTPSAMIERG